MQLCMYLYETILSQVTVAMKVFSVVSVLLLLIMAQTEGKSFCSTYVYHVPSISFCLHRANDLFLL